MAKTVGQSKNMNKILLIILLAQFIIVIDTTFMNVSISTLVADFHTSVTSIQNAITLYTLVMASFMIAGAKFGDIIGRKKAFVLGLIIYACGTTITALSPTLTVFMIGWSFLEGLGAAIMLPAMMSLIVSNFPAGSARTKAYAAFAAIAGIAAGIGPIIGGLFTTYLSWRLAFASELIIAIYIFFNRKIVVDSPLIGTKPRFDWLGFGLSFAGLVTVIEGIILASSYGLLTARKNFSIAGQVILSAGQISPTILLVVLGSAILLAFAWAEKHRLEQGKDVLLNITAFKNRGVSAGSATQLMQNLALVGTIFALSLYVQMELNYSAIQSGLTLLPLSIAVIISAGISGRILSKHISPRTAVIIGFTGVVLGVIAMGLLAPHATSGKDFMLGLILIGLGVGTVGSQNQNLVMSSVKPEMSNETSGILNTSLNIGSSLGTSLAGAMILGVFVASATGLVNSSSGFTSSQKTQLNTAITNKAQIVSNAQLTTATASFQPSQQQAILDINAQARQKALADVYFGLGIVGLLGILAGFNLPHTRPIAETAPRTEAIRKPAVVG
jgi:MFS family permease